jgi:tRNA(Arg) A34 adenosine deaminase TadA
MDDQSSSNESSLHLPQEILSENPDTIDLLPSEVDAYVSKVEPEKCGNLIKELSYILPLVKFDDKSCSIDETTGEKKYPWPALGHLRRVRRIKKVDANLSATDVLENLEKDKTKENGIQDKDNKSDKIEPPKKKKKTKTNNVSGNTELEILIGSVSHIDSIFEENNEHNLLVRAKLIELISRNQLNLQKVMLPGRPAKSQSELDDWKHNWWPSLYFEKQSVEYKQKDKALSIEDEWGFMKSSLIDAINDGKKYVNEGDLDVWEGCGAVAVDPNLQKVVSRSYDEWRTKIEQSDGNNEFVKKILLENPLNTPIMFCIQGVSRVEREAAMGKGMDSEAFKKGQYLCTNYDIYLTKEPGIFESMALVHSRVGRVFFGVENREEGGLGGTGSDTSLHCLPGTNHRFRAFKCLFGNDIQLLKSPNHLI